MHEMNRFGIDVVFGSDAAVLKSPTATYLTLKVGQMSTRFTVLKLIQDICKIHQMYHFSNHTHRVRYVGFMWHKKHW